MYVPEKELRSFCPLCECSLADSKHPMGLRPFARCACLTVASQCCRSNFFRCVCQSIFLLINNTSSPPGIHAKNSYFPFRCSCV